jgi:CBS-domain-containing membrane protein
MAGNYRSMLRWRWRVLWASLSLPAALAQMNEKRVVAMLAAINGGLAVLLISLLAWLTGTPMLFPSLAATVYVMFTKPFAPSAAPRSIILSHLGGMVAGYLAWATMSLAAGRLLSLDQPCLALCLSANFGFALTALYLLRFRIPHPPACATALIVATGAVTGWWELFTMAAAVIAITYQGVAVFRVLGVHVPVWNIDTYREEVIRNRAA